MRSLISVKRIVMVFALGLIVVPIFVTAEHAYAASTPAQQSAFNQWSVRRLPAVDQHMILSTNANDSHGTGNYTPSLQFLVYKHNDGSNAIVDLAINDFNCADFDIIRTHPVTHDNRSNQSSTLGSKTDPDPPCSNTSTGVRITLVDARFAPSVRFGDSYKVALIYVLIKNPSGNAEMTRAVVVRSNAGDNDNKVKLSYYGDRSANSSGLPDLASAPSITINSGSTLSAEFAPPCNFGTNQVRMYWRDADSGASPNGGAPVTYKLFENGVKIDEGNAGDGNQPESILFTAREKNDYKLTFYGISTSPPNTIKIWYPFDQAAYYQECDEDKTNGWNITWNSSVRRDDGTSDQSFGDISVPDSGDAPYPGRAYQFINDARNSGGRNITNQVWYCPATSENAAPGNCWNSTNDDYDRDWELTGNTQTINFYRDSQLVHSGVYGTNKDNTLQPSPWIWENFNVTAADGGVSRCMTARVSPSTGEGVQGAFRFSNAAGYYTPGGTYSAINDETRTRSWNTGSSATASTLCVNVPHFYNLLLPGISVDATVQQGSNVDVSGSVRETNEGLSTSRPHTNTKNGMERGIVEVKLTPGEPEPSPSVGNASQVGQAPCDYMIARVPGSELATCTKDFNGSRATDPVAAGATETLSGSRSNTTEAVGTKYCYATYAQHPRHINNNDYTNGDNQYSYSNISCSVIVKSPKVHFLNNDLTVGRLRDKAADGSCVVGGAPIIARGVPTSVSSDNLYGSWVANGAFATGAINGFGSAARPVGLAGGGHDNLTFGNQSGGLGRYSYSNCLSNPFGEIKDADSTDLASHSAFVLKADDPTTGTLTMVNLNNQAQDKTGYVSDGKSIEVGQKTVAPPPSAVPPNSVMTTVRINAKSVHANPGNVSCPKLQVVVTGDNSSRDQDTKPICDTAHQDYVYTFYLPTSGPKTIDVRFVNDSSGSGAVNRDIRIATIAANNKNLYTGTTGGAAVSGVTVTMRGAAANKSSCRTTEGVLLDIVYGSNDDSYCYSSLVLGGDLDAPLATQNPSYVPPESKTIQVTARGTSYNLHGGGGACPYMFININNGQRQDLQQVCETSESTYTFTTNTGDTNIDNIEVGFDPMDAWGGGQDRNLYVSNVRVGDANFAINQDSDADVQFKNGNTFVSAADAPDSCKSADTAIFMSATDNVTTGHCAVVRVNNVTPPTPPTPPVVPLDDSFTGFNGRDIVIYAKKTAGDTCNASSTGNITINQNIVYRRDGFASLFDIPRVTFIADCNIIIDDAVTDVNASLIAGDAIKTCSKKATNKDQCNQTLLVKGNISANRLLLWRTHGADLSVAGDNQPGETFDISPAQVVSRYNRDQKFVKPASTYEVDLPPRY